MENIVSRRVIVISDDDVAQALRNDELTEEELAGHVEDGSPVSYTLPLDADADAALLCSALGLDPGDENELADSDQVVMSWDPASAEAALEHLEERLEDPARLAADLVARAAKEPEVGVLADASEVIDILEQLDKGYEPDPDAHLAVAAAALLVRHVLAFRVARRNEGWVVSL